MEQTVPAPATPAKKRRLLVVSQHFWPENFRVNDLVAGFVEDGIAVDVLCGLPNYPKGEWFAGYRYTGPRRQQHAGAQVFRAGEIRRKGNTSLRILLNYLSFPFFALFSLPRLHGRKYDAVLCYETSPVLMAFPAIVYAKTHRVPLCTYVLDLWPDNLYSVLPVKNRFLRRVALGVSNWHYRRCNKLLALNEAAAAQMRLQFFKGKKDPEIAIAAQYAEDFYALPPTPDADADALVARVFQKHPFNLLFAGNLSPAQGLDTLVEAMRTVRAGPGGNAVGVVVLGDGMSRETLEKQVADAGLGAAFTFCGSVPATEVPRWTAKADALFSGLTKSENLGLTVPAKIATYFAAGRPVLAAMDGEGAAAVAATGAGLASAAGDAGALAESIQKLRAMDETARAKMGEAGKAHYLQHYRRATLLKQIEDFLFAPPPPDAKKQQTT